MRKDKKRSPIPAVLSGLLISFLITAAVFVICAGIMTFGSGLSENAVNNTVYITALAAVLAGSVAAAAKLDRRGLVNGMMLGAIYTCAAVLTGFMVLPDFSPGIKTAVTLAVSVLAGAIGGTVGINLK